MGERTTDSTSTVTEIQRSERKDPSHLVQISVSNAEINRRVSALAEKKRREIDEINAHLYVGKHLSPTDEPTETCARTSAVFIPGPGGKSHINVNRVVNMYGPQTRTLGGVNQELSTVKTSRPEEMDGLEERVRSMEHHLNVRCSNKSEMFDRLKNLEERILFLEGLSPEYFTSGAPEPKKRKRESSFSEEMSFAEIDEKIRNLKENLLQRKLDT